MNHFDNTAVYLETEYSIVLLKNEELSRFALESLD